MKGKGSLTRARITYFFRETFRAHSKDEYREFLARGLGENKLGLTGTYAWLYVRAFYVLFILFTVNTLILRLTGNMLYVPSVILLGGITFTIPFMIFLYELYPKRDLSIIKLFGVLAVGGTVAGALTQLGYLMINADNAWYSAFVSGLVEEVSKALVAVAAIMVMKNKNSYACFLIAAAVGAGFSVIEDIGYIFYYSNSEVAQYGDIRDTVYLFLDRGFSTFCTHVLWTGIVGWAYGFGKGKYKPVFLLFLFGSALVHSCWNLPSEGWLRAVTVALCTLVTVTSNIVAVRKSLFTTITNEADIERINAGIICKAKEMGERMRFTNAANLTFSLMCTFLSIIAISLCCLPIGMDKMLVTYSDKQQFIAAVQKNYNLKTDWGRAYDPNQPNVEERFIDDGDGLRLSYAVQKVKYDGYDGTYFYGYYVDGNGNAVGFSDTISLELDEESSRIYCVEYTFGDETVWVYEVTDKFEKYTFNADGTVSVVLDANEFEGYDILIALVASAVGISGACCVVLVAFSIKLRRVREDG